MNVGNRIKEKVKANNLTNEEFANKIGKHPKYIYQLYKQSHINTELLVLIAKVLDEDVEYFIKENDLNTNPDNDMKNYKEDCYKDRLIQLLEEKIEYLTKENERLKNDGKEQKAQAC